MNVMLPWQESDQCHYDYIEIFDGVNSQANSLGTKIISIRKVSRQTF